ncbi:hypothetical protein D2T29_00565 [Sinirhodobacter populi]|uniref:Uncharacterized protein n=1 Tax=Paenirhodobacter populi TaxID=2306993 RepID=A0A443KPW3_9RHOB|nr:hypothetical protein [Sinirhodobacter populi]RWR35004.1 hypothetical protein D2T29_00565 [Sinirhodobacter populi]
MNWWLKDNRRAQVAPLATMEPSGYWDRVGAGYTMGRIEDDSWNHAEVLSRNYEDELSRQLPRLGPEAQETPFGRPRDQASAMRRRARLFERAKSFVAQNPETRGAIPTSEEEFQAKVLELRKKEVADQTAILSAAPDNAFFAETLGRLAAGATDPVTLSSIPVSMALGPQVGIGMTVAAEAAIGAGSELLLAPRRIDVAEELDLPEPNIAMDVAMAGLTSGALAGAGALVGVGARRYAAYQRERGLGTDTSAPGDMSAGQYEADVTQAERALEAGTPLPPIGQDSPPNWAAIRGGIFAGESGGDFNALYGFSNRAGGPFANVRLTDMTIDQAIEFSAPSGPYARWVKGRIGRTATPMGAYQIVGTTLRDAKRKLGLTGDELFDEAMQERLGKWIYAQQGTGAWEGFRGPRADFSPDTSAPYGGGDFTGYVPTSRGYAGRGSRWDETPEARYYDFLAREASDLLRPRPYVRDPVQIPSRYLEGDAADGFVAPRASTALPMQPVEVPRLNVMDALRNADREAAARAIDPEAFKMLDASRGRVDTYRRWLTEMADQQGAEVDSILSGLQSRRTEVIDQIETSRQGGRRKMRAQLREIDAAIEEAQSLPRRFETRDMKQVRQDLVSEDIRQRDLATRISKAYRTADDGAPQRLSQLYFSRAWDDDGPIGRDLLTRYAEIEDAGELKSLMSALEEAAPSWATLRAEIEAGQVRPEFDITPHVLDALNVIGMARRDASRMGGTISDAIDAILDQGDLFSGLNPLSVALLRKFWRDGRAAPAKEISGFLTRYADEARTAGRTSDMLGASPADVLRKLDSKAFKDLPEDIPPIEAPAPMPVRDADLPAKAYDNGADSPEAEAADARARDDLGPRPSEGGPRAEDADARDLASMRAEFTGENDIELPDGRHVSDVLRDLDDDADLQSAVTTCLLEVPRA